jgi:ABC-type transport system substrate-binding protein
MLDVLSPPEGCSVTSFITSPRVGIADLPLHGICTAAVLALGLAACGSGADGTEAFDPESLPEAERYGGTAVTSIHTDPRSLNTLANGDLEAAELQGALLSLPLVRYDAQLEPRPLLAERWDTVRVTPDTLELTFHLRRDVVWHDGVPTTAEDVRFTYERMQDPRVGFGRRGFLALWSPATEVVDSFTIRFRLRAHTESSISGPST